MPVKTAGMSRISLRSTANFAIHNEGKGAKKNWISFGTKKGAGNPNNTRPDNFANARPSTRLPDNAKSSKDILKHKRHERNAMSVIRYKGIREDEKTIKNAQEPKKDKKAGNPKRDRRYPRFPRGVTAK